MRPLTLLAPLALLLGAACLPAVRHAPDGLLVGRVTLAAPEGWRLVRNRRLGAHHRVGLRSADGCCTIDIETFRLTRRARELPLDLLVDTIPLEMGRDQGIAARPLDRHHIVVDGREAWAITYRRYHGPHHRLVTTVLVRDDRLLAMLTLTLPDSASPAVVDAWRAVLDSFHLPGPADPDAPPFEPEPFLEPPP